MNHFVSRRGTLYCEGVSLPALAAKVGTPCYVYSNATLERHFHALDGAFEGRPHLLCYAVKASSTVGLLEKLAGWGSGFDIVSAGELTRVLAAKGDPSKVVFSGVGKTDDELAFALKKKILQFNVESEEELYALDRVARRMRVRAPFAFRVNPEVDARTHPYIATGLKTSKFGITFADARRLYLKSLSMPGLLARGLDCHIGSQVVDTRPVRTAVAKVAALFLQLKAEGVPLTHLDVGGGMGIQYGKEKAPSVEQYARAVLEPLRGLDATLLLEPGRVLIGNAGVLVTKVLYRKKSGLDFVVVDAGMNDLIRPALYDAHHEIEPVTPRRGSKKKVEVVGPVCESSDAFAHQRPLAPVEPGDLLAIRSAGAYGMSMASNYNSRPRPPEVLVEGTRFRVIRRRESLNDLIRGETR